MTKKKKILLSEVDSLTFYKDKWSTSGRTSPVPQLKCVGGNACDKFIPEAVQCYNRGSDGKDIQWACSAEMDGNYRFGVTTVYCEGYSTPDDPYILAGSCGLEYTIFDRNIGDQSSNVSSGVFMAVIVLLFILLCCCRGPQSRAGFNNDDVPPPLYEPVQTFTAAGRKEESTSSSGPGFWSGLAAGGALGYAAAQASSSSSSSTTSRRDRDSNRSSQSNSSSTGFGGTKRR